MEDARKAELEDYRELCERPGGERGPGSMWGNENTIEDGTDGDEVEGDGGSDGCADKTQSKGLGAPHCPGENSIQTGTVKVVCKDGSIPKR